MARDTEGRPVPVSRPDPTNHQERIGEQEQFRLVAQKCDQALSQIEDLSRRVVVLETEGANRLDDHLADFERRFDAMMLERLQTFEKRFEMMAAAAARNSPPEIDETASQ